MDERADAAKAERRFHLLWEAATRLDMAYALALAEDSGLAERFADTRSRIREELASGQ